MTDRIKKNEIYRPSWRERVAINLITKLSFQLIAFKRENIASERKKAETKI
jgi:hypothetical protein